MPVLPDVGSTITLSLVRAPLFSASQIMLAPMRHLTLYAGFRPSILARTVALQFLVTWFSFTSGVLPMAWLLSS